VAICGALSKGHETATVRTQDLFRVPILPELFATTWAKRFVQDVNREDLLSFITVFILARLHGGGLLCVTYLAAIAKFPKVAAITLSSFAVFTGFCR
jgi:hypothetical protein